MTISSNILEFFRLIIEQMVSDKKIFMGISHRVLMLNFFKFMAVV